MKLHRFAAVSLILVAATSVVVATQTQVSEYAGQEIREIKSLSGQDIDEIQRGQGWGLAKAAELNGVPGPRHVLDLRNQLDLTATQVEQIEDSFDAMQAEAISVGSEFLSAEKSLEKLFRQQSVDDKALHDLLVASALARAELRYVHLSRHLEMLNVLSAEQVATYNSLRGYTDDPCAAIPAGHDAELWRRHNNCQ